MPWSWPFLLSVHLRCKPYYTYVVSRKSRSVTTTPRSRRMATRTSPIRSRPLTRQRVLRAAVTLADRRGIEALSMRRLGHALGVEAMSLYNHYPGKAALLDDMVDTVFSEIDLPSAGTAW